jgi:uncharacterized protein (DUF1501 family)
MSIIRNTLAGRTGNAPLSRRDLLKLAAAGVVGYSQSGWLEGMAQAAANHPERKRACILLWMNGGPSTIDLFDLKPGHPNGGPFRETRTSVPGVRISEHLPRLARNMNDIAIVRSMSTREGDHGRASYLLRTGYLQQGAIRFPSLGSLVSKELANDQTPLPNFVSIGPVGAQEAYGSGYLGPRFAPLVVGTGGQQQGQQSANDYGLSPRIPNLEPAAGLSPAQSDARIDLLLDAEREFASRNPGLAPQSHATAYERAVRLMRSAAAAAFNLEEEPAMLREQYGRNRFGQGCLLARRLVERGVPFVEVTLGGNPDWDTHGQNFQRVQGMSDILDPAWSTLMEDLRARGLLDSTLIVWMGEFGRTPRINGQQGRDHWPNSFASVLAGGGIRGGQAYGRTSPDGLAVETEPTNVKSFIATIWKALGIDHTKSNLSNIGRPIRLADAGAIPIADIVG